eukprot:COSAG01_NODE_8585_length_2728_cov_14.207684_4_plen_77_part_00
MLAQFSDVTGVALAPDDPPIQHLFLECAHTRAPPPLLPLLVCMRASSRRAARRQLRAPLSLDRQSDLLDLPYVSVF